MVASSRAEHCFLAAWKMTDDSFLNDKRVVNNYRHDFFDAPSFFINSRTALKAVHTGTMKPTLPSPSLLLRERSNLLPGLWLRLLAWTGLASRPFRLVEPLPEDIVDMHCHVAGLGVGSDCFVAPQLRDNWRFNIYLRSFGVSRRQLMQQGDQVVPDRISAWVAQSRYVHRVVVLALDGVIGSDGRLDTQRTEVYVPNEFVAEACQRHSNLLFGASVNPYRPDALARLEWAKDHGAVLIKWLPPIMAIDPGDSRLAPFYRKLAALDLPLLTHTGEEKSFSRADEALGDPEKLRLPLHEGVTVIAAHLASSQRYEGERGTDRLARLMREYPNLYTDISALSQFNKPGVLREAVTRPEFSGRLLYGTDFPLINTALVSPWYSFHLSWRQKRFIGRTANPWDRDVLIKHCLGVPADAFALPAKLLRRADRCRVGGRLVSEPRSKGCRGW
jgi:predicted TIM-barrel fold metal-dependent hydrolase